MPPKERLQICLQTEQPKYKKMIPKACWHMVHGVWQHAQDIHTMQAPTIMEALGGHPPQEQTEHIAKQN